jgi:hypothetical protein
MRMLLVPMLLLLVFPPADVQAEEVKFRVRVLLATKQGSRIDPQIGPEVKRYLKKSFGARYSSFRQLDNRVLRVEMDQTGEVALPDQTVLKLRFRDVQGEFVKLTMEIKDLKTTIRIRDGGLFFQAGHRYKNGMLVLAISAELPGHKKKKKKVAVGADRLTTPRPEPRLTPSSGVKPRKKVRSIDTQPQP